MTQTAQEVVDQFQTKRKRCEGSIKKITTAQVQMQINHAVRQLHSDSIVEALESGEINDVDILRYLEDDNVTMISAMIVAGMDANRRDRVGNTFLILLAQRSKYAHNGRHLVSLSCFFFGGGIVFLGAAISPLPENIRC